LNPTAAAGCVGTWSPAPPHARLSLNLTALLDSRRIALLITGESKWRTYAAAYAQGPVPDMPIRAVLRQTRTPVDVMWSP
jgi:6-phosphogluconolactonase